MPWRYLDHAKISLSEENSFAPKFACWGGVLLQNSTCAFRGRGRRDIYVVCFSPFLFSLFKWEFWEKDSEH